MQKDKDPWSLHKIYLVRWGVKEQFIAYAKTKAEVSRLLSPISKKTKEKFTVSDLKFDDLWGAWRGCGSFHLLLEKFEAVKCE